MVIRWLSSWIKSLNNTPDSLTLGQWSMHRESLEPRILLDAAIVDTFVDSQATQQAPSPKAEMLEAIKTPITPFLEPKDNQKLTKAIKEVQQRESVHMATTSVMDVSESEQINNLLSTTKGLLRLFAHQDNALEQLKLAFDVTEESQTKLNQLLDDWRNDRFLSPSVNVVDVGELKGLLGAYDEHSERIYLAKSIMNDSTLSQSIFLEELGHYIDTIINVEDSQGDEGAIFSRIIMNEELSQETLSKLYQADDVIVANDELENEADGDTNGNYHSSGFQVIETIYPSSNSENVPINTNIILTFDDNVNFLPQFEGATVRLLDDYNVLIDPDENLAPNTKYTFTFKTSVEFLPEELNPMVQNPIVEGVTTFSFTTGSHIDTEGPSLINHNDYQHRPIELDEQIILKFSGPVYANESNKFISLVDRTTNDVFRRFSLNSNAIAGFGTDTLTIDTYDSLLKEYLPENRQFYLTIDSQALMDSSGNNVIPADENNQFTIDTEGVAPKLTYFFPSSMYGPISPDTKLALQFDEPVFANGGIIKLVDSVTKKVIETFDVNTENLQGLGSEFVVFKPQASLDYGTSYHVLVEEHAFKDAHGNLYKGLDDASLFDFTIAELEHAPTVAFEPIMMIPPSFSETEPVLTETTLVTFGSISFATTEVETNINNAESGFLVDSTHSPGLAVNNASEAASLEPHKQLIVSEISKRQMLNDNSYLLAGDTSPRVTLLNNEPLESDVENVSLTALSMPTNMVNLTTLNNKSLDLTAQINEPVTEKSETDITDDMKDENLGTLEGSHVSISVDGSHLLVIKAPEFGTVKLINGEIQYQANNPLKPEDRFIIQYINASGEKVLKTIVVNRR